MSTHVAKSLKSGSTLFEFDTAQPKDGLRVLTICGVTCEHSQIVAHDPGCSWCARKLAEQDAALEADRLARIAKARPR